MGGGGVTLWYLFVYLTTCIYCLVFTLPLKLLFVLAEDDLADVTGALIGVESKYYSIGLAIGLRVHELDCIRANYGKDVQEALGQVMVAWFHLNYNSVRFGLPTWRKIVEVVHKVNGGNHCALAKSIAANHPLRKLIVCDLYLHCPPVYM